MLSLIKSRILINLYGYARGLINKNILCKRIVHQCTVLLMIL
ncbi:hypothetical protein [Candidatus Lariskella endosymbiont of Epinotia ramella]